MSPDPSDHTIADLPKLQAALEQARAALNRWQGHLRIHPSDSTIGREARNQVKSLAKEIDYLEVAVARLAP